MDDALEERLHRGDGVQQRAASEHRVDHHVDDPRPDLQWREERGDPNPYPHQGHNTPKMGITHSKGKVNG